MRKKFKVSDVVLAILMISAGLFVLISPAKKDEPAKKINLVSFIPESFRGWSSQTLDTTDFNKRFDFLNEILVRMYVKKEVKIFGFEYKKLDFILEYGSDLRKTFSFHFPEICHKASGNEIEYFKPFEVTLSSGKVLKAKFLFIRGFKGSTEEKDKIVIYWLVIDNKQYYQTFDIKLDQMLSGALGRHKSGFLVRFDFSDNLKYDENDITHAKEVIASFIEDLYDSLDEKSRILVFGAELAK